MNYVQVLEQSLLRQAVVEVASLPDDDLAILLDIVAFLKQQKTGKSAADIRRAARQRAEYLRNLPRDDLARQFGIIGERIHNQVIARGAAVEGDWEGD